MQFVRRFPGAALVFLRRQKQKRTLSQKTMTAPISVTIAWGHGDTEFHGKLPKLRTWVRFPSPAPETLMTQLTLRG